MTAKPETAAEVLADINKLIAQNPLHDVSIGGFKTYLGHLIDFRDRLQRAMSAQGEATGCEIAASAIEYHNAIGALECLYAAFQAMDANDTALESWPQRAIDALACAGWAVVPCDLPFEVLGEAGMIGVFETGNPKHGWDFLLCKTRIGPHGEPHPAPARVTEEAMIPAEIAREYLDARDAYDQAIGAAKLAVSERLIYAREDLTAALEADHG